MDELALACDLDPIELRARNEPAVDPSSGKPWSGRHLVECLRTGARRFGWEARTDPGKRREGDWMVGLGVASSSYPFYGMPGSVAEIERVAGGGYAVRIGAADLGTGTWTALSQIAADALNCPFEAVHLEIGDTRLPDATVAGGSSGITSWGVDDRRRRTRLPCTSTERPRLPVRGSVRVCPRTRTWSTTPMHSFGAQFAEVRVHIHTGEVRVPRMLGVFSTGRIINPRTARSQFIGGMIMGMSMALFEESVLDHGTGHVINQDFAQYHVPATPTSATSRSRGWTSLTCTPTRWAPRASARSASSAARPRSSTPCTTRRASAYGICRSPRTSCCGPDGSPAGPAQGTMSPSSAP